MDLTDNSFTTVTLTDTEFRRLKSVPVPDSLEAWRELKKRPVGSKWKTSMFDGWLLVERVPGGITCRWIAGKECK